MGEKKMKEKQYKTFLRSCSKPQLCYANKVKFKNDFTILIIKIYTNFATFTLLEFKAL